MPETAQSNEEIIKRLQIVARDIANAAGDAGSSRDLARVEGNLHEARTLVGELAARIVAKPDDWGLGSVAEDLRDDTAADTLITLFKAIGDFRGQQPVTAWFAEQARSRLAHLQATTAPEKKKPSSAKDAVPAPAKVFTATVWAHFETEFPKEAFALRLRFLLGRTPEDMTSILDAPTPRAIVMRLNRARDRFQKFCAQAGTDVREIELMMQDLGEGRVR